MATKKDLPLEKFIKEFCNIIQTYSGRDKIMKALCYTLKLMAGYFKDVNPELSKSYATASSQISQARTTLRLIDDIAAIQDTLEYGWGKHENDTVMAVLNVMGNLVDLIFYPIEKICWLSDHRIVKIKNAQNWDNLNTIFWILSVYLNLMKTMRRYGLNRQQNQNTMKITNSKEFKQHIVLWKQRFELLSIFRLTLDLIHAGSYLPKGYLWGNKLSTFQIGAIGSLSAFIAIYQILAKRKLKNN